MDYRRFVDLREPACAELEGLLARARSSPRALDYAELERLAFLYRQLLHDHSLAAARYSGTAMARRLRGLVLAATHVLHVDSGERLPSLRRFVLRTFPRTVRALAPTIAWMAALFLLGAVFGGTLTLVEPGLAGVFLPAEALEGLERGEIWTDSIFGVTPSSVISSFIAVNNLKVAIVAWAGGALAGIGALWITLFNGLMLGTVLAATARFGMQDPLLEFIAAHGPLELSLIVVSAAAGLHMGRALVVADDVPRGEWLRRAGLDALVVLLGCLPWILLLGFVEGYVSPSRDVPVAAKVLLGLLLEGTFVSWVVFLGRRREAPATEVPTSFAAAAEVPG